MPQERLFREIVTPLLDRQDRPTLPVLGALLLRIDLSRQALLVRDRRGHLLFGLRQLTAHVDDQLVQHLFRVLGTVDRKSTRLNSSHRTISYAVFCLKKKKKKKKTLITSCKK